MASLHEKDDVSTHLEAADRIPIYRDTLGEWQLLGVEQLTGPFASGFPSYGTLRALHGRDDFMAASDGLNGFVAVATSGAATTGTPPAGRIGIAAMTTSTSSSGACSMSNTATAIPLGSGRYRIRWDVNIPTASDGSETFTVRVGCGDSDSAEHTDAVMFRYIHSANSGNWVCVTRSNGSESTTNTAVSAAGSSNYQVLEIEVNAAGTSVAFYIDGTLVATHTGNIPTGTSRVLGGRATIVKSVGSTSRTLNLDLVAWSFEPTTPL